MTEQRSDFKAELDAIEANIMAGDMSAHQVFTMMRQMVSVAPQVAVPEEYQRAAERFITEACCDAVEKLKKLAPDQGWDSGESTAEMYIRRLRFLIYQTAPTAPQVSAPEGWRISRIALDQLEIITPAGEKHWIESNSDDPLELVLYALIDAMLAGEPKKTGQQMVHPDSCLYQVEGIGFAYLVIEGLRLEYHDNAQSAKAEALTEALARLNNLTRKVRREHEEAQ